MGFELIPHALDLGGEPVDGEVWTFMGFVSSLINVCVSYSL